MFKVREVSNFVDMPKKPRTVVPCSEGKLAIQPMLLLRPSPQTLLSPSLSHSVGEGGVGLAALVSSVSRLGKLAGV